MNRLKLLFSGVCILIGHAVGAQDLDLYQRIYTWEDKDIATVIREFADSLHSIYIHAYKIEIRSDDDEKTQYMFGGHPIIKGDITYTRLYFPPVNDESTARTILQIADSLAHVGGYNNLRIVNGLTREIVRTFATIKSVDSEGRSKSIENLDMPNWQREVSIDAALLDLNCCARIYYYSAALVLPSFLFSPEIIDRIKHLYRNPMLTREEAEMMAQAHFPLVPYDTTGYMELRKRYLTPNSDLNATERDRYGSIYSELNRIKKANMTFERYYDSLNRVRYAEIAERLEGQPFNSMDHIVETIGDKRIYAMADFVDSLKQVGISQYFRLSSLDVNQELARLRYKDYPQRQIEKYTRTIDSCSTYLKNNPDADRKKVDEIMKILIQCHEKLRYINTPESFYRMAPMLLINNMCTNLNDRDLNYSIGAYFFVKINQDIINIPKPEIFLNVPAYIDEDMPRDFLPKMYQWMLDNKDNYKFNHDLLNGGQSYQPRKE
jgi:hypothetical protein